MWRWLISLSMRPYTAHRISICQCVVYTKISPTNAITRILLSQTSSTLRLDRDAVAGKGHASSGPELVSTESSTRSPYQANLARCLGHLCASDSNERAVVHISGISNYSVLHAHVFWKPRKPRGPWL